MTDHERNPGNPTYYNLHLPPEAAPLEGDEQCVGLLAQPDIRSALAVVNDDISSYYDELRSDSVVHELFRGATASGRGVAVAEVLDAEVAAGIDPQRFSEGSPISGHDGRYVLFEYELDGLTSSDGMESATTPWVLVGVSRDQERDGTRALLFEAPDGSRTTVNVPLSRRFQPRVDDEGVVSFQRAALGERRVTAMEQSLGWLGRVSRTYREYREGTDLWREWKGRADKVDAFRAALWQELCEHPAWADDDGARSIVGLGGMVNPDEVALVATTVASEEYQRRGVQERDGLLRGVLLNHRLARLDQFEAAQ
ncbi:MAG TPA: hypothetical protein VLE99_04860 [Candidatus Saccharimonadales bacterium]|nr:hypothetical protein [Candidatus Saccharimonadales bacterium]